MAFTLERSKVLKCMSYFYTLLFSNPSISRHFNELNPSKNSENQINLDRHLDILCDFWMDQLSGTHSYTRNAMLPHKEANQKEPFTKEDFVIWLRLFEEATVEKLPSSYASLANDKARKIAQVIQAKTINL